MQLPTLQNVRILAAVATLALLTLAGVVWLGVAVERSRVELADMERSLASLSLSVADPAAVGQNEALAKLAADVAALSAKIDALANDQTKNVSRQSAELKALAGRIEAALAAARPAPPAKASTAKETRPNGKTSRQGSRPEGPDGPPPYYGPNYPAWPAY